MADGSRTERPAGPAHVAVIMDGNGRWAKERGLPRIRGHEAGADSVRAVVRACRDHGVRYLTLYAFSVENWKRPKSEIQGLMQLLRRFMEHEEHLLHEQNIRLRIMGRLEDLPKMVQRKLQRVMRDTAHYEAGHLILALSYGGRTEIATAARRIAEEVRAGKVEPKDITESVFAEHLYIPDVPDPDLMIRTSGEMRLSNFMLWQLSYAELYTTPVLWPDFREEQFAEALEAYRSRDRRFGGLSAPLEQKELGAC